MVDRTIRKETKVSLRNLSSFGSLALAALPRPCGTVALIDDYNAFAFPLAGESQRRPQFAVVADPENVELNVLHLQYRSDAGALVGAGVRLSGAPGLQQALSRALGAGAAAPRPPAEALPPNIDPAQTLGWVKKYFSGIAPSQLPSQPDITEPRQTAEKRVVIISSNNCTTGDAGVGRDALTQPPPDAGAPQAPGACA